MRLYYYRTGAYGWGQTIYRNSVDTESNEYVAHDDNTVTIREKSSDADGYEKSDEFNEHVYSRSYRVIEAEVITDLERKKFEINSAIDEVRARGCAVNEQP